MGQSKTGVTDINPKKLIFIQHSLGPFPAYSEYTKDKHGFLDPSIIKKHCALPRFRYGKVFI